MEYKDLLGGKGANLAEMTSVLKLPVPPGFTISTDACRAYMKGGWPAGSRPTRSPQQVTKLEKAMGRNAGRRRRSAAGQRAFRRQVLDAGDDGHGAQPRPQRRTASRASPPSPSNERFAYDSYRRFISMYGRIVLGVDGEHFEHPLEEAKTDGGCQDRRRALGQGAEGACASTTRRSSETETGKPFPQDPDQAAPWRGRGRVRRAGTAHGPSPIASASASATTSAPPSTCRRWCSATATNSAAPASASPATRRPARTSPYGDFLINAQGEDVVAGIRNTEDLDDLKGHFPKIHAELIDIFDRLERHYTDMCDTEFTIEQGKLWMLQTRVGKRTGAAALRMAVDMTKGSGKGKARWKISKQEAIMRVAADHLDQVLHPQFAGKGKVIAKGLAASPGAAVGKVYFTADDAADADERGEPVILVRSETSPEDVHGMMVSQGILTARGGLVSHAAVVARGWGTPAIVGADMVKIDGKQFTVGDIVVKEGDIISLDGTTGEVVLGEMKLEAAEPPAEFTTILEWADQIRKGKLAVRANADTGEDATNARQLGAEGIGLCRTEHMFLAPDRLPVVREMILADTPQRKRPSLAELGRVQQIDFEEILEAMDGLPVTIRLLDPPLHEFLPSVEELKIKQVTDGTVRRVEGKELKAAEDWAEHNPMIGTRGVRLGVVKPGLYAMQVKALLAAAAVLRKKGKNPIVEVMIPLTVTREELALGPQLGAGRDRRCVEGHEEQARHHHRHDDRDAACRAVRRRDRRGGRLLQLRHQRPHADDVRLQPRRRREPDDAGVPRAGSAEAQPVRDHRPERCRRARSHRCRSVAAATKKNLKLGVCGEHGGDPESIQLFYDAGLDYVSCSPFRVPIARLAAAQAIITGSSDDDKSETK